MRPARLARSAVLALALTGSLLLADLAVSGASAALQLRSSACSLLAAARAAERGQLDAARQRLAGALVSAAAARAALSSPALFLARLTPARDDLGVAEALAGAAAGGAWAGLAAGSALPGAPLRALYAGGTIDLDAVAALAAALERARQPLQRAQRTLSSAPRPHLGPLAAALNTARARLGRALKGLDRARSLLAAAPALLGAGSERRYFLALQTPSEARGGGGLVGVYGVLSAERGRLEIEHIDPIRALVPRLRHPVEGPRWFARAYGDLLGLSEWREANLTPIFPVSARVLLAMYEASTGERLDGVIALDPYVLAQVIGATGPLRTHGLDVTLTRANTERVLLHDIYVHYQGREMAQNSYLKHLVARVQRRLESGRFDAGALARGLVRAVTAQHLKIYVTDQGAQAALAGAGLSGDPRRFARSLQMVFHNNFAANKIDYFLHRSVTTQVQIEAGGDALVTVSTELDNRAPARGTSVLTRSGIRRSLPAGLNQMTLHTVVPRGAEISAMYVDGRRAEPTVTREGPNRAASLVLELPAGTRAVVDVLYRWKDALRAGVLELTLFPQATVNAERYKVEVVPPAGHHIIGPARAEQRADGSVAVSGTLNEPRELRFALQPGAGPGVARRSGAGGPPC